MSNARHNLGDDGGDAEAARGPHGSFDELTHVTAPPGPSPAWRSDESAALRETWLAFGELLDAAGPADVDRRALVEAVRSRDSRGDRRLPWPAVAAALGGVAAAVVVAVMIARAGGTDRPKTPAQVATGPGTVAPQETRDRAPSPGERLPPVAVASTQSFVIEIAWDDRMAGRLEPLRRGVRRLQAGPNRHATRVDNLRARMSALQEDWSRNRL